MAPTSLEPKQEGKLPLRFDIEKLVLRSVGPGKAMAFTAKLDNAKPPGLIDSAGSFGPWQRDDPGATAVSGNYSFQNADLGAFKGISGTLSSTGKYRGVLEQIEVDGQTDTPQFALKRGGEPVHLATTFHTLVDGINGNTRLDPVEAKFLHSEFICQGSVAREPGSPGKTVSLEAVTTQARIEDILWLVMGTSQPMLTGGVDFKSQILIPPGPQEILDKLKLDGQFGIRYAQFASPEVKARIKTLSDRARGITKKDEQEGEEAAEIVPSNFRGRFKLDGGTASFAHLAFDVPGARITLAGDYNLESQQIDMQGVFQMQATLSKTQAGVKHWILKPFDPLFKKDGAGFEVPIFISGTKDHPDIQAEVFHKHFTIH